MLPTERESERKREREKESEREREREEEEENGMSKCTVVREESETAVKY